MITQNGRPKGFAYVEFEDADSLREAISLNGEPIFGREIRIDIAAGRTQPERSFDRGGWRDRGPPSDSGEPRERPKLDLKPRSAETAPKGEVSEAYKSAKANPFGDAVPREVVLQSRPAPQESPQRDSPAQDAPAKTEHFDRRSQRGRGRGSYDRGSDRGSDHGSDRGWERGSARQPHRDDNGNRRRRDSNQHGRQNNRQDRAPRAPEQTPVVCSFEISHCRLLLRLKTFSTH